MIDDIKTELLAMLSKAWAWILYTMFSIIIGVVGKISYDLLTGRKITLWGFVASVGLGIFVGVVSTIICMAKGWTTAALFMPPIATLLSEKIILALFSLDYNKIFAQYFNRKTKE